MAGCLIKQLESTCICAADVFSKAHDLYPYLVLPRLLMCFMINTQHKTEIKPQRSPEQMITMITALATPAMSLYIHSNILKYVSNRDVLTKNWLPDRCSASVVSKQPQGLFLSCASSLAVTTPDVYETQQNTGQNPLGY